MLLLLIRVALRGGQYADANTCSPCPREGLLLSGGDDDRARSCSAEGVNALGPIPMADDAPKSDVEEDTCVATIILASDAVRGRAKAEVQRGGTPSHSY